MTERREQKLLFQAHGSRAVEAAFDGGKITSDGGALLLRELELKQQIVSDFAGCFIDHRDPGAIEFTVEELVRQRVFGLALGYEDLNDHDKLRVDPLLALLCGRADVTGADRRCAATLADGFTTAASCAPITAGPTVSMANCWQRRTGSRLPISIPTITPCTVCTSKPGVVMSLSIFPAKWIHRWMSFSAPRRGCWIDGRWRTWSRSSRTGAP